MIKINTVKHAPSRMIHNGMMMISFSLDTSVPAVVRFFTYRKILSIPAQKYSD
jgi:hypothetical protein